MSLYLEKRHLDIVNNILAKYNYRFFAFGSRVTGKNTKFSDLDLFYFADIPSNERLRLEEDFEESDLPFTVDLIDYNSCDAEFQNIILQHYLCIKSSDCDPSPRRSI
jgi:predicted nucleotidyltransferase